eukprot:11281446-Alexandrium_andersonii.AAC.1
MVQGQPDGWAIIPVRWDRFYLALVQGAQCRGVELPCYAERHHSVPAPGEPSRATVLMTAAGPQGQ